MQWAEQADVLNQFGEGVLNLIIATSVVEEGLDVQVSFLASRFRGIVLILLCRLPSRATLFSDSISTTLTFLSFNLEVEREGRMEVTTSTSLRRVSFSCFKRANRPWFRSC